MSKHKCTHNINWKICTTENQSWAALQTLPCMCANQKDPCVIGQSISTQGNCASAQVGEVRSMKITSTFSCAFKNLHEEEEGTIMARSTAIEPPIDTHHHLKSCSPCIIFHLLTECQALGFPFRQACTARTTQQEP